MVKQAMVAQEQLQESTRIVDVLQQLFPDDFPSATGTAFKSKLEEGVGPSTLHL